MGMSAYEMLVLPVVRTTFAAMTLGVAGLALKVTAIGLMGAIEILADRVARAIHRPDPNPRRAV